ncbi:MAG: siphovirus Gp157 family protein [Halodesulfovibrio sp.]
MTTFSNIQDEISSMLSIPDEDLTDEQRVAMDAYLNDLAGAESDKVDAFGQFVRVESARAEACKKEAQRLLNKAKTAEGRISYLKHLYLCSLQSSGLKKVQGSAYTLSIREADSVDVTDVAALPDLYLCRKETVEPDKVVLREALKGGMEIPGAALVKTQSLMVR